MPVFQPAPTLFQPAPTIWKKNSSRHSSDAAKSVTAVTNSSNPLPPYGRKIHLARRHRTDYRIGQFKYIRHTHTNVCTTIDNLLKSMSMPVFQPAPTIWKENSSRQTPPNRLPQSPIHPTRSHLMKKIASRQSPPNRLLHLPIQIKHIIRTCNERRQT